MENKLRSYIEEMFQEAPLTKNTVELKEEILQNLIDKYHDLISEGKSEEAAYNIAIASIGDIQELIHSLNSTNAQFAGSYTKEEIEKSKRKTAVLTSISIFLYCTCVLHPIFFDNFDANGTLGACLMFTQIGIATMIIVYAHMTKITYQKIDDTVIEDFKEWKAKTSSQRKAFRSISAALWTLTTALYFIVSFMTMAWHITWVIFLIAGAIECILKAIIDLRS